MSDNTHTLFKDSHKSPFLKDDPKYLPMSTIQEEIQRKTPSSQCSNKISSRSKVNKKLTTIDQNRGQELTGQKSLNLRQSDQFNPTNSSRCESSGHVPQTAKSAKGQQLSFRHGQSSDFTAVSPTAQSKLNNKITNLSIIRGSRNHENNVKSFDMASLHQKQNRESNSRNMRERASDSKDSKIPPSSQNGRRDSSKKYYPENVSLNSKRAQSKNKNSSDLTEVMNKIDKSRNQGYDKGSSIFNSLNGNRMEFKTDSGINKQTNLAKSIHEHDRSVSNNPQPSQPIVPSTGGSFDHTYQSRNENQMNSHAYWSTPDINNKVANPLKNFEEAKFASKTHGLIISYAANTHQGIQRNYNEDRVSIILNMTKPNSKKHLPNWPKCSYFAIYDGHGGSACADYLKDTLHQIIINQECFPANPAQALTNGCLQAESQFLSMADQPGNHEKAGSCAIVVLIVETNTYIANVGDSRAIMSAEEGKKLFVLSRDHRPNEETEKARIVENGGKIYQTQTIQTIPGALGSAYQSQQMFLGPFRVLPGRLSVSRTFGDIEAKLEKYGGKQGVVIAQPEIASFQLQDEIHDFIVLGCDGIFDRLSNLQVQDCAWKTIEQCKVQQPNITIHQLCGKIVDAILQMSAIEKSFDNLTIVLVAFKNFQNTFDKLFQKDKNQSPDPNKQQIIKIKDEDASQVQNSETKLNQLEANKKLLLERIINQKREAKLSSRGNSQNPSQILKDQDNPNQTENQLHSQRKKSPFAKERTHSENPNESLPNVRNNSSTNQTVGAIQNSFAQIQSKRSGTRNHKPLISTNSNNVYYNQNSDSLSSNLNHAKANSRNRVLASFYNSEKPAQELDAASLYLQRKTNSNKIVNTQFNDSSRQEQRTRSGHRKPKQSTISEKKSVSLVPNSGSFTVPKQNIPPIMASNFTPKHFSGNSITGGIVPNYGQTPSTQNPTLFSGMGGDRYMDSKNPLKSSVVSATHQEMKKKLPSLKSSFNNADKFMVNNKHK